MVVCLYTLAGTYWSGFATVIPFDFAEKVSFDAINKTTVIYYIASLSFLVGVLLAGSSHQRQSKLSSKLKARLVNLRLKHILLIYFFMVIFLHLGVGVQNLYLRAGYTLGDGGGVAAFRTIYVMLLPISILLIAFIRIPILRYLLLTLAFFWILGTTSRSLIMIPVFYFVGLTIRKQKVCIIPFFLSVFLTIAFATLAIDFRNNALQGVIPNTQALFLEGINFDLILLATNYILSYSFFATAMTVELNSFDLRAFYLAITPAPGSFVDLTYMISQQKINEYAPYTAIGVLGLAGHPVLIGYYSISGYLWARLGRWISNASPLLYFPILILFFLYTILSVQYNLRGVTRFIYYLALISLLVAIRKAIVSGYKK